MLRAIQRPAGAPATGPLLAGDYIQQLESEYQSSLEQPRAGQARALLRRPHSEGSEEHGGGATGPEDVEALRASAAGNLTQLVRLWFHHNTTLHTQWPEQRKECAPGCTRLGNCNAQTGECECPYGRAGPACEVLLLPACR